jgi:xanthine dehydrogenase accessory factor
MVMTRPDAIFRFLLNAAARRERTALVTVTDVIGRSSRAPGAHMAVSAAGAFQGSLSGGCVEAAVVGEAQRVIENGRAELIRFGAGSRFIDIRLPCGGGLDLLITPDPRPSAILHAANLLGSRESAALLLGGDGTLSAEPAGEHKTGWNRDIFVAKHDPALHLYILGHGAETRALTRLALAYGADVTVLSPDEGIVDASKAQGAAALPLKTPSRTPYLRTDPHSAVVLLFHDHDWEADLLSQALEQDAYFIGAMGSLATHVQRLEELRSRGFSEASLARITAPIGLIPATRDPETLALSALAQIVAHRRDTEGPREIG